jgi:hypothetical protein
MLRTPADLILRFAADEGLSPGHWRLSAAFGRQTASKWSWSIQCSDDRFVALTTSYRFPSCLDRNRVAVRDKIGACLKLLGINSGLNLGDESADSHSMGIVGAGHQAWFELQAAIAVLGSVCGLSSSGHVASSSTSRRS